MNEMSTAVIIRACEDVLKALAELNGRMPPKRRARLHLFMAFKMRDILIALGESLDIDEDDEGILERIKDVKF